MHLKQKHFLFWNLIKQCSFTNFCADQMDFWITTNHSDIFLSRRTPFGIGSLRNACCFENPLRVPWQQTACSRLLSRYEYNVYLLGFCQHQEQVQHHRHFYLTFREWDTRLMSRAPPYPQNSSHSWQRVVRIVDCTAFL